MCMRCIRNKQILCLDLNTIPKIAHYVYEAIPKLVEI